MRNKAEIARDFVNEVAVGNKLAHECEMAQGQFVFVDRDAMKMAQAVIDNQDSLVALAEEWEQASDA